MVWNQLFHKEVHFNSAYEQNNVTFSCDTSSSFFSTLPLDHCRQSANPRDSKVGLKTSNQELCHFAFDSIGLRLTPTWWNKSKTKLFNSAPLAFSSSRTGSSTLSFPQWESTQLTFQGELRGNFARLSWLSCPLSEKCWKGSPARGLFSMLQHPIALSCSLTRHVTSFLG